MMQNSAQKVALVWCVVLASSICVLGATVRSSLETDEFANDDRINHMNNNDAAALSHSTGEFASTARSQRAGPAQEVASSAASAAATSVVDNLMGANNKEGSSSSAGAVAESSGGSMWPFGPSASAAAASSSTNQNQKGPNFSNFTEMSRYLMNPMELLQVISKQFGIPKEKIIEQLGGKFSFNVDAMLNPMVATIKIIEKTFVPDACRLRFFCKVGSQFSPHLRQHVSKISPQVLGGSAHVKALSQGISGSDCDLTFETCEPTLKKPFAELKQQQQQSREPEQEYN